MTLDTVRNAEVLITNEFREIPRTGHWYRGLSGGSARVSVRGRTSFIVLG